MVAPTSFFMHYGGHIRILAETRALQALGHEITIVTYYKGEDLARFGYPADGAAALAGRL